MGFTQESFAEALGVDRSTAARWESGRTAPQPGLHPTIARLLELSRDEFSALLWGPEDASLPTHPVVEDDADEQDALELARRSAASDVGEATLGRLELTVDDLAAAYPVSAPWGLLGRARQHLGYVARLLDARKTLNEHRRLLVVGGWLSLLAGTLHVDLKQDAAAIARLRTARSLAQEAHHDEIAAWSYETAAWQVLTAGDHRRAVELARSAQTLAPAGGSVAIQAIAQEGRAHARLHQHREARAALEKVGRLAGALPAPDRPEHHYRYDPSKAVAYVATTLAWMGDPAAEPYAREIITRLQTANSAEAWPRRLATANLDLALALLVTDRVDEACAAAKQAIGSGRVVPSNHWRALEVVTAVESRGLAEADDLRDAYDDLSRTSHRG